MAKIETKVKITKLQASTRIVEDDSGRRIETVVKFEYQGSQAKLDDVLLAMQGGNTVEVTFSSPQAKMDV